MCINRIYYGEEAISRIERNEEGKRNWLSKKEKKKIKEKRRKKIMRKLAKWFEEALESYVKLMGNTYGWGGRL